MTVTIKVPILPESVADAVVLEWSKQVGEAVSRDELLVEVETDKITLEVVAPDEGVITDILAQTGETVMSEQPLATLETGAAVQPIETPTDAAGGDTATPPAVDPETLMLSPSVRHLVAEHGIDPSTIKGTGRDGRLTKEDVLQSLAEQKTIDSGARSLPEVVSKKDEMLPDTDKASVTEPAVADRQETREPMSRLRQTIAGRLIQSQQTAALLTTFNEVNMQPVMALRTRYKESFEKQHGARLGFMSFFVKASVVALQRFPLVNAYIDGTDIVRHNYHDIGIAVSSPRGLVVPILRNCAKRSFAEIESQIQLFGSKARDGKIDLKDLAGGTFTLTNGGVFGSLLSTPIVNPPQSAILGMHKIQDRPMAENGQVVIRPMMYLALSYDHRIIDGKEAVQFLVTIKDMLEDPARLLLDC